MDRVVYGRNEKLHRDAGAGRLAVPEKAYENMSARTLNGAAIKPVQPKLSPNPSGTVKISAVTHVTQFQTSN